LLGATSELHFQDAPSLHHPGRVDQETPVLSPGYDFNVSFNPKILRAAVASVATLRPSIFANPAFLLTTGKCFLMIAFL